MKLPRATRLFVKVNGKLYYLWRAVDHEGEILESVVTAKRDKTAAVKFLKRIMKKYGRPRQIVTDGLRAYSAAMKEVGNADCQEVGRGTQQSRGEFASAVSTTRARNAGLSKRQDVAEIQLSSRPGPQPFQSGAPSRHPPGLQAETLCRIGRVAPSRPDGCLSLGVLRHTQTSCSYSDKACESAPRVDPTPVYHFNVLSRRSALRPLAE